MTSSTATRVPAGTGGRSALRRLVAVSPEDFAGYWGRRPLLSRAADLPSRFEDLFSTDAVDELLSRRGLRTPFVRVAKDGQTLPDSAYTAGGGVGAGIADQVSDDKLLRLFADGATIVLQGLHRTWEPILLLAQDLARELGHPVQANAYVTPPQSTGFSDHYDVHDVFVLQVAGEKRWRIRPPVLASPLRDQPWTERRAAVEAAARQAPLLEEDLRPGDCLYLPRGYLHSATALGDVSTHLTIGVHPWTRRHLADELVAAAVTQATEDERVRASLAVGADPDDVTSWAADVELVREALVRAIRQVPAEALAGALGARARRAQRAAPVPPVATAMAAASLSISEDLLARPSVRARLDPRPDGRVVLSSRAGELTLSRDEADAVAGLLAGDAVPVAALGVDLAKRLVVNGVALVAGRATGMAGGRRDVDGPRGAGGPGGLTDARS